MMKLKKLTFILFLMFNLVLYAQKDEIKLDEILNAHKQLVNAGNNLHAVETMKLSGTIFYFGEQFPLEVYRKRVNCCRIEVDMGNAKDICIMNDGKMVMKTDSGFAEIQDPLYIAILNAFSNFDLLADYDTAKVKVRLTGTEDIDGISAYNLQVTRENSDTENWFIDSNEYKLIQVKGMTMWYNGRPSVKTIMYMDYRPEGGVNLPHYYYCDVTTFSAEAEITSAVMNPELSPDLFNITTGGK